MSPELAFVLVDSRSKLEVDSSDGDGAVGMGLVCSPIRFSGAGSESRARRLGCRRETGLLVEAGLDSLSVRSPLGPHPEAMARTKTINPARLGAASPNFIGRWCHCVTREGKCLLV